MNESAIVAVIISIAQAFFSKNPTVEEIIGFLPEVTQAISNAKSGTSFTFSFPEAIDGKAGTSTFSWAPN